MQKSFIAVDISDTEKLARMLADLASSIDCITLSGEVGSGKTTFARAFIRHLVGDVNVQSPTFLLVQNYDYQRNGDAHSLQHLDLYRVKHSDELIELGLDDLLAGQLCLIEWPEIASAHLPEDRLDIVFTHHADDEKREITCHAKGHWQNKLNSLYFCP